VIDWDRPVVFEDGRPAYLHATLSKSGKCKFAKTGENQYSDTFATWVEQGVLWLVHSEPNGGQAVPYGKGGQPVSIWDDDVNMPIQYNATGPRLVQKDDYLKTTGAWREEEKAMAEHELWGMF
jgi:hypothetical protein